MKNKEIKAIVFNPNTGSSLGITLYKKDGSILESIYEALDCQRFESVRITQNLEVYVDEEGLLVDDPVMGLVFLDENSEIAGALAGNILFVNHDEFGNTVDLSDDQVNEIMELTTATLTNDKGRANRAIIINIGGKR